MQAIVRARFARPLFVADDRSRKQTITNRLRRYNADDCRAVQYVPCRSATGRCDSHLSFSFFSSIFCRKFVVVVRASAR
jgi:hypothetical protein